MGIKAMLCAVAVAVLGFSGVAEAAAKKSQVQVNGVINLNQASEKQLDLLPGIGPKVAHRIVEYRQKSPFTSTDQVTKVKGFGKKRYQNLKEHLSVSGTTNLTATRLAKPAMEAQGRTGPKSR